MKANAQSAARDITKLAMVGAFAALAVGLACTTHNESSTKPVSQAPATYHPAALKTVAAIAPLAVNPPVAVPTPEQPRMNSSKPVVYRSRDYGVSFQYPWQYAYFSARAIANGDDSLKPNSDGHDGQVTLARIAVPRGFYPDTDFDSAYFTLSLNQNIKEEECAVTADKPASLKTESINGVDFHWVEKESGGHGAASRVRNYVTFANGACYEVEMGLKTSNQDGLAREVDSDQVFHRLESILRTVKIQSEMKDAPEQMQTATATAAPQQ
jgi:hypothetical protein